MVAHVVTCFFLLEACCLLLLLSHCSLARSLVRSVSPPGGSPPAGCLHCSSVACVVVAATLCLLTASLHHTDTSTHGRTHARAHAHRYAGGNDDGGDGRDSHFDAAASSRPRKNTQANAASVVAAVAAAVFGSGTSVGGGDGTSDGDGSSAASAATRSPEAAAILATGKVLYSALLRFYGVFTECLRQFEPDLKGFSKPTAVALRESRRQVSSSLCENAGGARSTRRKPRVVFGPLQSFVRLRRLVAKAKLFARPPVVVLLLVDVWPLLSACLLVRPAGRPRARTHARTR